MSAVICAIARDEELYLDEWIKYHLALGFSHVYLYDNADSVSITHLIDTFPGQVTVIHCPGHAMQMTAYAHFLATYNSDDIKWVSFHDVDEFIVLKKHVDILGFLNDHCATGAVCINWYLFGTAGNQGYSPEPVVKRFRYKSATMDRHVKGICCIRDIATVYNAHFAIMTNGTCTKDTNGKEIRGPYNDDIPSDVAQINHYFVKSHDEHVARRGQGGFCGDGNARLLVSDEAIRDANTIYDDAAWVFYKTRVKKCRPLL